MNEKQVADAYNQHGALVYRRCLRIVSSKATAEDLLHEVLLRMWKYPEGYEKAESRLAWLYRVSDNCCFDRLRANKNLVLDDSAFETQQACAQGNALSQIADQQIVRCFLGKLDRELQQVFVLLFCAVSQRCG